MRFRLSILQEVAPLPYKICSRSPDKGVKSTGESSFEASNLCETRSEWGMRALQATFSRLKDPLPHEQNGEQNFILLMIILLFNLRSYLVGMIQTLKTYMLYMSVDANDFFRSKVRVYKFSVSYYSFLARIKGKISMNFYCLFTSSHRLSRSSVRSSSPVYAIPHVSLVSYGTTPLFGAYHLLYSFAIAV